MNTTYFGITAALAASLLFSTTRILIRLGLANDNTGQAHYTTIVFNNLFLWPVAVWYTLTVGDAPNSMAVLAFFVAGFFATGLGRLLAFSTLNRLTVTETTPFISTSPLFAFAVSLLLLSDRPSLKNLIGTGLVVLGLLLISGRLDSGKKISILVGLMAAFFYGVGEVLRKYGTNLTPNPPLGAALGALAALTLLPAYNVRPKLNVLRNKYFVLGGLTSSAAVLMVFVAYSLVSLYIAVPLVNSSPLMTLLISAIFLRDRENLKPYVVGGGILASAGIVLIVS